MKWFRKHIIQPDRAWVRLIFMLMTLLVIGATLDSMAQKQGYFWYFGKNAGLDFNGFDPVPLSNSQMDAPEGVAAISDTTGQLLFYTDGVNIWDYNHELIKTGMSGDLSSTQSATIVPDPDNSDQYFVFTTKPFITDSQTNFGGNYYTIKIQSGGTGTVIYDYAAATGKGGLAINSSEKFVAVPFKYSTNKTGYWFLMHEFNTSKFWKVKLDSVWHDPIPQDIGNVHANNLTDDDGTNRGAAGQMKVNDLGTRLALAVEGGKYFELFRFSTVTGLISNPMQIPAGDDADKFAAKNRAYGVEFSPTGNYGFAPTSGNYLYGSTRDGQIYQWDLSSYDQNDRLQLIKQGQILHNFPERECGALQIAPNGKIYVAFNGKDYLGVISSPMRPNSRFELNGARLVNNDTDFGGLSGLGLPAAIPIPKSPEPFYFENLCLGDTTLFYITDQNQISTPRSWTFVKLSDGSKVTKSSPTNEYLYRFPAAGNYGVTLTLRRTGISTNFIYTRYLTINPLPVVKLASQDRVPLCWGSKLDLDAGSGALYEWEDGSLKMRRRTITTSNDSMLPLEEYRVKVTDYHGCIGWDTLQVERKNLPSIDSTHSIKAFCGDKNGVAKVYPKGNIQNYTFRWEGFPGTTSNTLSGINGGDYIVHAINKSTLCEMADTIHVDELGGTNVKISHNKSIICPGDSITVKVEGATEVEWISHPWLAGSENTLIVDTTTVFIVQSTNRDEGRPCVTVVRDTVRVFPKDPPELGIDRTPCGGNPITVDGGENYIDWKWSNGQTGRFARVKNDIPALVLHATDKNSCVFTDTVAVHFLPGPVVDLGNDTIVCSKDPIELYGGSGESYLWSTGETTQTILAGKTGDYWETITLNNCSLTDTIHIQLNNPDLFKIDSVSFKDITCYGANNGEIRVFANGDGRNFYYSIDNGFTFLDNKGLFEHVQPGKIHVVKVWEDSVCIAIHPVPITISQPDSLTVKYCALPPSCKDCTDGIITVAVTGGTPPYEIRLNGSTQDSTNIKGLGIGNYSLTVTDSHQCAATPVPIVLAEGKRPVIVGDNANKPVCSGSRVTLRVENSKQVEWINPPLNYNLEILVYPLVTTTYRVKSLKSETGTFTCETILEYTIEVFPFKKPDIGADIKACDGDTVTLDGGDYSTWIWSNGMLGRYINLVVTADPLILTVTYGNACALKDTISVDFYPHPPIELGPDKTVCSKDPIVLRGGPGDTYADKYLWSTGETTPAISVIKSDKYLLEITKDGCSSSDSVNIRIVNPDSLSILAVNPKDNSCFGGDDGSIEVIVHGTGSSYQYSINNGPFQDINRFDNLPVGEYSLRIKEDSLCTIDYGPPITIGQPDSIHVSYQLKSPGCETCNDGKLILTISGGTPPYQIILEGAPIGLITETIGVGNYTIIITDANLCVKTVEFKMELLKLIPNVLTTNGDGVNELWKIPMLIYYPDAIVKVFTVAGKLAFESPPGYPIPWDGRDNGNFVPMGTYYYLIDLGPGEQQLTGYITILR